MSHKNCGHEATKSARARCRAGNGKIGQKPQEVEPKTRGKYTKVDRHELFMRRIDTSAGPTKCWPWTGEGKDKYGYGLLTVREGDKTKRYKATRWMMEKRLGRPLKKEEWVLHRCDNPPCCNPDHLRLGTAKDNAQDILRRGRNHNANKTHCKWGHEYTSESTGVQSSGTGRLCLICQKLRSQFKRDKNFSQDFSAYVELHRQESRA